MTIAEKRVVVILNGIRALTELFSRETSPTDRALLSSINEAILALDESNSEACAALEAASKFLAADGKGFPFTRDDLVTVLDEIWKPRKAERGSRG